MSAELLEEIAGKLEMELLWTNASPTSNFAAQNISLDLSGYDEALVYFRVATDQYGIISARGAIGDGAVTSFIWGDTGGYGHRWTDLTTTQVKFYGASYNKASNNKYCIPVAIYGIKGVKK